MTTPAAGAPTAAPVAPAPEAPPAKPQTLLEVQRGLKSQRVKSVEGPAGGFVKMPKGSAPAKPAPVAPPLDAKPTSAGEKAGAPVVAVQPDPAVSGKTEPSPEAPKPPADPMAELKKGFDAKSRELADLRKQLNEYEEIGKSDFRQLVLKLAEHYKADPQAVAEALLLEKAQKWQEEQELAKMSPEARELHELRKEKAGRDAQAKADAEAKATADREAVGRHTYEITTNKMIEAHKLLPESIRTHPEFNGRAALRIRDLLVAKASVVDPEMDAEAFLATIDPAKLAAEAWADHRAELKAALEAMDDAGLDEFLDPKLAERWTRKLQTAAVKRAHPALTAQPRASDGKFAKDADKPAPKSLSAMAPSWASFLPKTRR